MKSLIKRTVRKIGRFTLRQVLSELKQEINFNEMCRSKESQILLMLHYRDLLRRSVKPLPSFDEVGFRCCSQFEEDGILLYIFSLIGTVNKTAVEICAGNGIECNTSNLIINHGWQGFLFDGDRKNVEIGNKFYLNNKDTFLWPPQFKNVWITAENVNSILKNAGVNGEIDLLSLDIDGMDYWVWKALDFIKPRVVVCETHGIIDATKSITVPYNPNFKIEIPDYHSASLAAMTKLGNQKGYRLVGSHRYGFNAFFVRNSISDDLLPSVPVSACLNHPYAKHAMKERWPKVKGLHWEEV